MLEHARFTLSALCLAFIFFLSIGITVDAADITETESWEDEQSVTEEEIELIALVTMAEAEGESEEGQRLVIDTILNRVNSGYFPNTINGVIYQKNQFSSIWNGRIERCKVTDAMIQLVKEELESQMSYDCVFFTAGDYSRYGTPLMQVGHHYFSSYD